MRIKLAYGDGRLALELPDDAKVVARYRTSLARSACAAARRAAPARGGPPAARPRAARAAVAISVCDGTRAQPRELMIPAMLDELDGIVDLEDVIVLVATGTHRGNTDAELRGDARRRVVDTVRVVNHDARDDATLVWLGGSAPASRSG